MEEPELMSTEDLLALPAAAADYRLPYGNDPYQFGDLYMPKTPHVHPLVIVIHGGCWSAEYDLTHLSGFCAALAQQGVAVWSLEYRRVGNDGGGWPGTFMDVARGADFVRQLAARSMLDLSRVVAVGHSAGGHLALWLAVRRLLTAASELYMLDPLVLRGVVALAGIPDLRRAYKEGVCDDAVRYLLGGRPSEAAQRYEDGSPSSYLPLGVPLRLIHGARDVVVPLEYVRPFAEAAAEAGDDVTFETLPDAGHYELITPRGSAWETVLATIQTLIQA